MSSICLLMRSTTYDLPSFSWYAVSCVCRRSTWRDKWMLRNAITQASTTSTMQAAGHSILLVLSSIFGSFVHDKDILPARNHRT